MEKYRVEHAAWEDGSGWKYNETIDNVDDLLTADDLYKDYGGYCENDGDEIREIDNESNEAVSVWRRIDG